MNIFERLIFRVTTGADIRDLGRADEVIIRYKNKLLSILEDPETGEIKSLTWMGDGDLFTEVAVRDFWLATAPEALLSQSKTRKRKANDAISNQLKEK